MMDIWATLRALAAQRTDELTIIPFTGAVVWEELSHRPELDMPFFGSMGKAASTGLGVALAVPHLKVWVVDGDGSLLMNLGCLVTTAQAAPANFIHFVLENGVYETTGGQPIPGHERVDFAGMARSAGFRNAYSFDDIAVLERELPAVLRQPGPTFACLKTTAGPLPRRLPRRMLKQALPEVWAAVLARASQAG